MALNTQTKPAAPEVPKEEPTIELELASYVRYNRAGHAYDNEHAYKFTQKQALILLQEVDPNSGKPVWRRYKPKEDVQPEVPRGHKRMINAQSDGVKSAVDVDDINPVAAVKRIEIGDDDPEVAALLQQAEDGDDGVTV